MIKSLNNNIILAVTDKNDELVMFGTGIGFNRKKGDLVELNQATKIFYSGENLKASQWLDEISPELLTVTEKIIHVGEEKLQKGLNQSILFSLADHLRFALERKENEMIVDNPIQWEIPHLYGREYEIGKAALQIIQEDLNKTLPTTEASFIALHFVNAQMDSQTMGDTIQITQVTKNIVKIIQSLFEINLDKTTINYSRFITHLRYFIARQKMNEGSVTKMDETLKKVIQERYVRSYACGLMIQKMLEEDFQWQVTADEIVYLVIHIEKIIQENKSFVKACH